MKRAVMVGGLVVLLGATGWAATRLTGMCGSSRITASAADHGDLAAAAGSGSDDACESPSGTSTASAGVASGDACASDHGTASGQFDPVMSGACRFSCATKLEVDEASVVAQPGASTGDLTRCPVSGVVFAVDAERPSVHLASGDYVVCCAQCAGKLAKHPERFLKL